MLNQHIYNSETIENNKTRFIIAEFMGLSEIAKTNGIVFKDNNTDEIHLIKYHSDWNWLMPVVEKILNLKNTYAQERQMVFNSISPDINITYTAIISFIKWYNENK